MSSVTAASRGDLTSRARIVAAALDLFGSRGFTATTLREIAGDAGVSAALVVHHFGSKDGVRRECDRRVVEFVRDKQGSSSGHALDAAFTRYGVYAARALSEDSTESKELFAALLQAARDTVEAETAAGRMRRSADPEALALALLVLGLAPFAFGGGIARWAGGVPEEGMARLAVPIAEIYTRGLVTHAALLDAVTAGTRSGVSR